MNYSHTQVCEKLTYTRSVFLLLFVGGILSQFALFGKESEGGGEITFNKIGPHHRQNNTKKSETEKQCSVCEVSRYFILILVTPFW